MATKYAIDGPGGPILGGPSVAFRKISTSGKKPLYGILVGDEKFYWLIRVIPID